MTEWYLWQFRWVGDQHPDTGQREFSMSEIRPVADAELSEIQWARRLASEINGNRMMGPLIESANRIVAVLHRIGSRRFSEADFETVVQLSMALDEWLMRVATTRRRVEQSVSRCFGEDAATKTKAMFQALYDNTDYRLAWEWRNAAQHKIDPLDIVSLVKQRGANGNEAKLQLVATKALSCGYSWPLPSLIDRMTPSLDLHDLISSVHAGCDAAVSKVVLAHESDLVSAVNLLTGVLSDDQDARPGGRIVAPRFPRSDGSPAQWQSMGIHLSYIGSLSLLVDAARSSQGLRRLWPDITASGQE